MHPPPPKGYPAPSKRLLWRVDLQASEVKLPKEVVRVQRLGFMVQGLVLQGLGLRDYARVNAKVALRIEESLLRIEDLGFRV